MQICTLTQCMDTKTEINVINYVCTPDSMCVHYIVQAKSYSTTEMATHLWQVLSSITVYVCAHVCVCVCVFMYVYIYIYIYMYNIYIHT